MRRLTVVLLGIVVLFGFGSVRADTEWFYTNLSDPTARQVILSPRYIGGHLRVEATSCPPDGAFLCYNSPGFSFAVPKVVEGQRKWTLGRASYEIKKESRFSLFGQEITVIWIDQTRSKKSVRFLYSRTRGLIGFASLDPKGSLFLLENACGFGASSDCVE